MKDDKSLRAALERVEAAVLANAAIAYAAMRNARLAGSPKATFEDPFSEHSQLQALRLRNDLLRRLRDGQDPQ